MGASDVKYPWPSTVNVTNFVTVKPCVEEDERSNKFNIWKEQMLCLLDSQDLLGFVDGEILPPEKASTAVPAAEEMSSSNVKNEQKLWKKTDRLVKGWILGSIGKDALDAVWNLETARDVWLELDKIFKHKAEDVGALSRTRENLLFSNDVKYPWPSTVNVANFVTVKPCLEEDERSNNFNIWKQQMLCLLESQNMLGFVDGKIPPPDEANAETEEMLMWRRSDRLVKGWILGSLGKDALDAVWNLETASDVWLELDKIFKRRAANFGAPTFKYQSLGNADAHPGEAGGATPIAFEGATSVPRIEDPTVETDRDYAQEDLDYMPLDRAVQQGNLDAAKQILDRHPPSSGSNTIRRKALMRAAGRRKAIHIVEELVKETPFECIASMDADGNTPLISAAALGNKQLAISLATKIPSLIYTTNKYGNFPIQMAAMNGERDLLDYLLSVTKTSDLGAYPYTGIPGLKLLLGAIDAEFLDIALSLVEKYPELARLTLPNGYSSLQHICSKKSIFCAERRFTYWERFISYRLSLDTTLRPQFATGCDIESITHNGHAVFQRLRVMLGRFVQRLGPIQSIKKKTVLKLQALELVKRLCKEIESLGFQAASGIYLNACAEAAQHGIHEAVEEIRNAYPGIIYHSTNTTTTKHLLHIAVENRSEHVYNLICNVAEYGGAFSGIQDFYGNNLLHVAGKLAPSHKLDEIPGAALQMQHELQWYKEVEEFVSPYAREILNSAGRSPKMVFTEEHKQLKEAGEKWMKDTANSCTIAATLIATIMFAAAITVPGGSDSSHGFPIFSGNAAFIIFAVSDAISLFASATSLLMFLAILASRYAEEDFLYVLPKRLIIGLGTLFLSITFMMAAFSATIYLVFGRKNAWVLISVGGLACLPVASFVLLQFPLLFDLTSSTYGPGMFSKKSNR